MSFRVEIEVTIEQCLGLVKIMRDIDPWIPIQTVKALLILANEVMLNCRVVRGVDLAGLMDTTQASATRNIQLLAKHGLIEIHESPLNKIDKLVKLTLKGRATIHKMRTVTYTATKSRIKGGKNERKTKRN